MTCMLGYGLIDPSRHEIHGGNCGVTVIIQGNGHTDQSSSPEQNNLLFTDCLSPLERL